MNRTSNTKQTSHGWLTSACAWTVCIVGVVALSGSAIGEPDKTPALPVESQEAGEDDLDALLGLDGDASGDAKKDADDISASDLDSALTQEMDPAKGELDRKLSAQEASDAFQDAVRQMSETADRLEKLRDAGAVTQRLHEDILRKLDIMIEQAQKQQSSSSSSSSSASDSDSQSQSQPKQTSQQGQQQTQNPNEGKQSGGDHHGPPQKSAEFRDFLDSTQAGWGALPQRLRKSLVQGQNDYFSAMYRSMTEAYYRKLARETTER